MSSGKMNARQVLQKIAEEFYRKQFGGQKDKKEKHGDFYIQSNGNTIGFEVYTPEEPLSRSSKKLKEESSHTKYIGKSKTPVHFMGGGLDPTRFNQLLERVLDVKGHQFTEKVTWPKIFIVCLYFPGAFADIDNDPASLLPHLYPEAVVAKINYELFQKYPQCCAIFVGGASGHSTVRNLNAKYSLADDEWEELSNVFRNNVSRLYRTPKIYE